MATQTISEEEIKEFYRQTGKLSKFALDMKFHNGECLGCAPVGYVNVVKDGQKWVVRDEFKAPIIQVAFRLAGDGNMSLRAILRMVTDLGLTSRNGKKLGPSALWNILTNPFYAGQIRHDGFLRTGNHEPIIEDKLFQKVQLNLSRRSKKCRLQD